MCVFGVMLFFLVFFLYLLEMFVSDLVVLYACLGVVLVGLSLAGGRGDVVSVADVVLLEYDGMYLCMWG